MFSKFKVTSAPNAYSTHFPLAEVYEAEICRLRNENQFLGTQLDEALAKLHRLQAENAPFKASQKAFFQLSRATRNNKERRIRNLVIKSLKELDEFVPIEIKFSVQGEEVIISLGSEEGYEDYMPQEETTQRVLVAMDSGLISDEPYHELRMSIPEDARAMTPPINVLKDERNQQNRNVEIHQMAEAKKEDGARRNIREILEQLLLISDVKEAVQANGNVINLRLAADGRKTSNKIGTVMAVFSILEERNNIMTKSSALNVTL